MTKQTDLEMLAAEARKEYFRKWRAANKDKVRTHQQRFWEKKALELLGTKEGGTENDRAKVDNNGHNC